MIHREWQKGHEIDGKQVWLNDVELAQYFCVERSKSGKILFYGAVTKSSFSDEFDYTVTNDKQRVIISGRVDSLLSAKRAAEKTIDDLLKQ